MPLYDILNEFQKGHSHIAVVYKDLNSKNEAPKKVKDGEQHDLSDNYKNKGENATLDKGRDLNKSIINFSFFVEYVLSKYYVLFAICWTLTAKYDKLYFSSLESVINPPVTFLVIWGSFYT